MVTLLKSFYRREQEIPSMRDLPKPAGTEIITLIAVLAFRRCTTSLATDKATAC